MRTFINKYIFKTLMHICFRFELFFNETSNLLKANKNGCFKQYGVVGVGVKADCLKKDLSL